MTCEGCLFEMEECYRWQQLGFDAGLDFSEDPETGEKHCFVFVLKKNGEYMIY